MLALGIDSGGSKTIFALCDTDGNNIGMIETPTIAITQNDEGEMREGLNAGIDALAAASGARRADIGSICFGMPCYGESDTRDEIIRRVSKDVAQDIPYYLCNDSEVAWAGSFALEPGINIVAGTGTIAFGVDTDGTRARCGGWGYQFSDEGSGYWLGLRLLELFCKQSDGRIPERGPLYDIMRKKFSLKNDFEIIDIAEQQYTPYRDRVASLQLLLLEAAKQGDASAIAAYAEAGQEIALNVSGIIRKLDFAGEIRISYSGGIFKVGALVLDSFQKALEGHRCVLCEPLAPPWAGSLLLALQRIAMASPETIEAILRQKEKEARKLS